MRTGVFVLAASAVAAVLPVHGAMAAAGSTGADTGALVVEAELHYPAFPCDFTSSACATPVDGALGGTVAGVHEGTPWVVTFDDAALEGSVGAYTIPLFVVGDACAYENSRGPFTASSASVTGMLGTAAVIGVEVGGELQYLRHGDHMTLGIAQLSLTLHTTAGTVVTVEGDQWALGTGTWEVTDGAAPSPCTSLSGGQPLTAHVSGAMVVTPRVPPPDA